jgi:cold shock CspA family protein
MKRGQITRYFPDRGFGWIRPFDESGDLFFNTQNLCREEDLELLAAGVEVWCRPTVNTKGPCAYHVQVVDAEPEVNSQGDNR